MSVRYIYIIIGIVAAYLFYVGIGNIAPFTYDPLGPRPFPLIIIGLIIISSIYLTITGYDKISIPKTTLGKLIISLITFFVFSGLIEYLGFSTSCFTITFILALLFNAKLLQAFATAVVLTLFSYLLFNLLLEVALPTGLLGF